MQAIVEQEGVEQTLEECNRYTTWLVALRHCTLSTQGTNGDY